jgi:PleD family two-component response regulator
LRKKELLMDDDNDLDFTHLSSTKPGPQPTREQMVEARHKTLPGMPALKKTGYYVNITNRPTQRIIPRSKDKYELLIIDHEQDAVLPLVRALMLAGFNVRSAENREEIVIQLKKSPLPDALMLDITLPGLNGLDLLARIHQHPQLQSTPILVITSKFDEENVAAALARGASGYITKPCKPETLVDSVHAVLGVA